MSEEKNTPSADTPKEGEQGVGGEEHAESEDGQSEGKFARPIAIIRQKLKLILMTVGAIVVIGGGAGIYFSGFGATISDSLSGTPKAKLALPEPSVFHDMAVITVDLKPSAKRKRAFIRFAMTIEVYGEKGRNKLISEEAKILDSVTSFLREQTFEDISGNKGSKKLREGMVDAINKSIVPEKVIAVLFKEILVR